MSDLLSVVHGNVGWTSEQECKRGLGLIPTLTFLVGLPASGKTTYAHQLAKDNENTIVLSSDAIREELYGDESIQGDPQKVFNLLHKRVKENLKNDINVVLDATNVKSKQRRAFVESLNNIDCYKECIIIATPYEECILNNKYRERVVPEYVIERMYRQWDTPYWYEGWDNIIVNYADGSKPTHRRSALLFPHKHRYFKQNNPHHKLTLGEHCSDVGRRLENDKKLRCAGYMHDCGKVFTKSFINSKGEKTDIAHYYGHENVGAYDALFYSYPPSVSVIDVSVLVNLHMYPYMWERDNNEKMRLKYKKLWGDALYNDILRLHEADKAAH